LGIAQSAQSLIQLYSTIIRLSHCSPKPIMTESLTLAPRRLKAHNTVALPGSKSISNRTLLLAALADNACEIRSLLKSDDTDRMLEARLDRKSLIVALGGGVVGDLAGAGRLLLQARVRVLIGRVPGHLADR